MSRYQVLEFGEAPTNYKQNLLDDFNEIRKQFCGIRYYQLSQIFLMKQSYKRFTNTAVEFISSIYNFNYIFDQFSIFKLNKFDVGDLLKIYHLGRFQNKAELYFCQNFHYHFILYYLSKKIIFLRFCFQVRMLRPTCEAWGCRPGPES